jgi:CRISPR/Cas system-associated protein Csx1
MTTELNKVSFTYFTRLILANDNIADLEERLKKLENEIKILKITSGSPSGGEGVDGD